MVLVPSASDQQENENDDEPLFRLGEEEQV
jgi:hypothetical protein